MTESAKLRLPYLAASQAQKHVTHNEALTLLDTLVQASVIDKDLTTPPGSPAEGDCYIVAATGTGAWNGWDNRIVRYIDGEWRSYLPGAGDGEGWLVYVQDEANLYVLVGGAWTLFASSAQPLDADLTAIAALSPSNDDVIQRKAGAWTKRTMAQLMADLGALGQIPFPATQIPSSDPNTLDDYEEGTWTATFTASTTPPTGVSYSAQTGWYTKIGNLVAFGVRLIVSNVGSGGAGNPQIGGLPFVVANLPGAFEAACAVQGVTLDTNFTWLTVTPVAANSVMNFHESGSGQAISIPPLANVTATFDIRFATIYRV